MMSDISIDLGVLKRVRTNIEQIGETMERPGKEMEEVDGASMGVSMLASRMNDFGDEWSYGIKQIKKFSGAAVKTLDAMQKAFEDLDDTLAKELRKAREERA
ncbi:hypothetical protein ACFW4O_10935 [Streptomyces mutabilis]|jgi:hypothetical protein|uniref:hypothetical protein n=2 Tax=Streptomyces TaxID=1883 RepID=UPI0027960582|nr:hypothetical protein [Streptomyces mutabilis]